MCIGTGHTAKLLDFVPQTSTVRAGLKAKRASSYQIV